MRIQLPVETWIEILDWLRRRELLKKLNNLWDREFTPIVQDWLHKYSRNVRIGGLWATDVSLYSFWSERGERECEHCEPVPFAEVDMPGNITSFGRISIGYLDSTVLTFLQRMRSLFHGICFMLIDKCEDRTLAQTQTAVHRLMPMISSSGSIESFVLHCQFLQFFSTNYPITLSNAKLLEIRDCYRLLSEEHEQILVDWLFTKRDDGQPRMLVMSDLLDMTDLCEKIQERFMHPTRQCACPFLVRICVLNDDLSGIPDIENVRTGEQLTFKTVEYDDEHDVLEDDVEDEDDAADNEKRYGLITNCPAKNNKNVDWLAKKTAKALEWDLWDQQQAILVQEISSQLNIEHANQQ